LLNSGDEVLIPSPFPLGVVEVCNQGSANGIPSDDPDTPANDDTTCTPVVAAPNIVAGKVDSFLVDPDNDNIANPGDSPYRAIREFSGPLAIGWPVGRIKERSDAGPASPGITAPHRCRGNRADRPVL